jgi:glycosyltransferase involved in cell wall biosynthesis
MKKLLVITPIHNKEEFLEGAIESVLQQTYKNTELILIDDNSTDNSLKIAKSYEHLDNVTVLHNPQNKGCYYTRNRGLNYFKDKEWDYFTIHDSDDISDINRFETIINYLNSSPKTLGLKTGFVRMHYDTKEVDILNGQPHIGTSEGIAFYSRKVFETLGYYDNTRFSGDTDYMWRLDAWIKTNNLDYKLGEHKEPLYVAYLHDDNLTKIYNWETDRPNYWRKSQQDIQQMVKNNNFYREIFE